MCTLRALFPEYIGIGGGGLGKCNAPRCPSTPPHATPRFASRASLDDKVIFLSVDRNNALLCSLSLFSLICRGTYNSGSISKFDQEMHLPSSRMHAMPVREFSYWIWIFRPLFVSRSIFCRQAYHNASNLLLDITWPKWPNSILVNGSQSK